MCVGMSSHKAHLTRAAAPAYAVSLKLTDKGADDAFFSSFFRKGAEADRQGADGAQAGHV